MTISATCRKVTALLSSFIDNKLDKDLHAFVKNHLEVCPSCHRKYIMLKNLIKELRIAYKDQLADNRSHEKNRMFNIKEYQAFHGNLSSYFDNELPLNESVDMKKYMIKFPNARRALEEMYHLHKLIDNSVGCTKKNFTKDYARIITYRVRGITPLNKRTTFLKTAAFLTTLLLLAFMFLMTLPAGKSALDRGLKFFKKNIYVETQINQELAQDLMY